MQKLLTLTVLLLLSGCAATVQKVRDMSDAIYYTDTPKAQCMKQCVSDAELPMCIVYVERQRRNRRGY